MNLARSPRRCARLTPHHGQTRRVTAATQPAVQALLEEVDSLLARAHRVVVGLVGPPGTGKSTVASALVSALEAAGTTAALVPMDGFHLDQRELERLGRAGRKGAPDTFDVAGYVALLRRLREATEPVTYGPRFDRELEQSVGSALAVPSHTRVVVTEGNYLLLDAADLGPLSAQDPTMQAWGQVRRLLDRCWFVDTDHAVRLSRLIARHVAHGRTPEQAREWVQRTDEPNAVLVRGTRHRGDGDIVWD